MRLSLTLLLWFIYLGYFMLRGATENPERGKRFAAVLGIVGAVDIPLIHVSVHWFRSQHPQPVVLRPDGPKADPEIVQTLLMSFLAFTLVFFALLLFRYGLERLHARAEALRIRAELDRPVSSTQECFADADRASLRLVLLLALPALAPAGLRAQEPSSAAPPPRRRPAGPPPIPRPRSRRGAWSPPGLPQRAAPPRTLRDYTHVFAAFAMAWILLFGYVVSLGRRWSAVERELAARG